jgi:hypothetical protein
MAPRGGCGVELAAYQLRTKELPVCQPTRAPFVAYAQFVIACEYGFDCWADGTSLSTPHTSLWEPKSLHGQIQFLGCRMYPDDCGAVRRHRETCLPQAPAGSLLYENRSEFLLSSVR